MKETDMTGMTGKDKIQKICDILKKETLDPAKQQAKEIVENANMQASEIINQAKKDAQKLIEQAKKNIEQENKIFESSLSLAAKQPIEALKQSIEKNLFDPALKEVIIQNAKDASTIAKIINAIVKAVEKGGIDSEISVYVAKDVSPKEIVLLLLPEVAKKLKEKDIILSDIVGGVKVKLKDMQLTLDLSSDTIKDLLANYIRKDLRDLIFKS
jgi:V/A-type H+/Na+-transporting ATPase subunit E